MAVTSNTTDLLVKMQKGDQRVVDWLFQHVYDELKRIARLKLRYERRNHTLNTKGLVHEAYLKLVDQTRVNWQNRAQFMAIASQAMHRILINHAKKRGAQKRNQGDEPLTFKEDAQNDQLPLEIAPHLLTLDEKLEELKKFNPRGYMVVECRFFGGMTFPEIAEVAGLSEKTVRRSWAASRAWLHGSIVSCEPHTAAVFSPQ